MKNKLENIDKSNIALVIPVYNEGNAISLHFMEIKRILKENAICCDIIFVDDGSSDNTYDELKKIQKIYPKSNIIKFTKNFGKEVALYAALSYHNYQLYVILDSDLQHPPKYIPQMLEQFSKQDLNILIGIKNNRGIENKLYRFLANSFYYILKVVSGVDFKNSSDFMVIDNLAAKKITSKKYKNFFFRGVINNLNVKKSTFLFNVEKRQHGASSFSINKLIKLSMIALFCNRLTDDDFTMFKTYN